MTARQQLELVQQLDEHREVAGQAGDPGRPCDVVVIGAGPYGLGVAAHLRQASDLDVRVFGKPMSFWGEMPAGMRLRSPWAASHIPDPRNELTLDGYRAEVDPALDSADPLPLGAFVAYGRWFQRAAVPGVDERRVATVDADGRNFRLTLDDGAELRAATVVVAAGIAPFAWIPDEFRRLPPTRVSHSGHEVDLSRFAGRRLIVVGGGQSALESAALAREAGADVELVLRARVVRYLVRSSLLHRLGPLSRMLYASSDVGPAGASQLIAHPSAYRTLPRAMQDGLARRAIRPAGAAWLMPRLRDVPVRAGAEIVSARCVDEGVELVLADGATIRGDHVLLGTGWRVDIERYGIFGPRLLDAIRREGGYPVLDHRFCTSVPGLYIVGAPAAWSFGPLMRFVAGATPAARTLARAFVPRGREQW